MIDVLRAELGVADLMSLVEWQGASEADGKLRPRDSNGTAPPFNVQQPRVSAHVQWRLAPAWPPRM